MAEIICPNCGARYNIPDDVLGEKGRKVTCSVCGHTWHAMPPGDPEPMVLEQPMAEPAVAAAAAVGAGALSSPPAPEPAAQRQPSAQDLRAARAKQLAEIRQIVDEVQSAPDPASSFAEAPGAPPIPPGAVPFPEAPRAERREQLAPEPKPAPAPPPDPAPAPRAASAFERLDEDDDGADPLRAKLARPNPGRGADGEKSRKKMMRKHSRRAKKLQQREKRNNGYFLTGFLLVLILVSILVALYVLSDQIVAQFPGTEAAMANYVERMDELRLSAGEVGDNITASVTKLLGLATDE